MRYLTVLLVLAALLVSGCGSSSLQARVDTANRKQLALASERSYLLMTWDDEPKEWLLVSDVRTVSNTLNSTHSMLTFHEGHLSISSRVSILEGKEITDPAAGSGFGRETPAARQERYDKSRSLLSKGQKWTGGSATTNINPYAVEYHHAGTVTFRGREVSLLAGEVTAPRSEDPMSVYEHARVVVGIDAQSGALVLEYLVNLRPKAAAANRMLIVHDPAPVLSLGTMQRTPPEERTASYLRMYSELRTLGEDLHGRFERQQAAAVSR